MENRTFVPLYGSPTGKFQGGTRGPIAGWRVARAVTAIVVAMLWTGCSRGLVPVDPAEAAALRTSQLRAALTVGEAALGAELDRVEAGHRDLQRVDTPLETGLVIRRRDVVVASSGVSRSADLPGPGYRLIETPLVRLLAVRLDRDTLSGTLTLLLDAVPGIPRGGEALTTLTAAEGVVAWQWSSPPGHGFDQAADVLAAVEQWMQPVATVTGGPPPGATPTTWGTAAWLMLLVGLGGLGVAGWWRGRMTGQAPLPRPVAILGLLVLPWVARRGAEWVVPAVSTASLWQWFLWQGVLVMALAALVLLLLPPQPDQPGARRWTGPVLLVLSIIALLGMEWWRPATGWPVWLPWLQGLGLWLLLVPMAERSRLISGAAAVSLLAMLATWGVSLDRRMTGAHEDLARLRAGVDAEAMAALDEFAATARDAGATRLDRLYAAWSRSRLATLPVPIHLALSDGERHWFDAIALDSVAVAWADLDSLVAVADRHPYRSALIRDGVTYQTLVLPFPGDTVATVTIGPRSRLLAPTRVGRLVGWRPDGPPGYSLTAGPWTPDSVAAAGLVFGRRGRMLRASVPLGTADDGMTVRATVAMASPQPFAVRALLTLLLDIGVIVALWWGIGLALGRDHAGRRSAPGRSHRRMLTGALAAFFVIPALLFTGWSAFQVQQEARREGQREVARALGGLDAWRAAEAAAEATPQVSVLQRMAFDIDAELGVYRGGMLIASSTPLLADLGLMPPVIPPLELATAVLPGEAVVIEPATLPVRLGFEDVGDSVGTLLAALLPRSNADRTAEQTDLLLLLLLAALVGGLGAVRVAGWAAQSLSRPIERLTHLAGAIGRGESVVPPAAGSSLAEFTPVFDAIARMERDLRTSEMERAEATAQAARITAWGEMARQVAHEIKNPLTPMRLGLQHLERLRADQRPDFAERVGETADRLLREVDRLDRIARAFARYGGPPAEGAPLVLIAIAPVVQEVAALFALGGTVPTVVVEVAEGMTAATRQEELIQVLLNLLENARQAGATQVRLVGQGAVLEVQDNGAGMTSEQIAAAFEPTFSTTTSGTGLGLPIVRRLVEGWGGEVALRSTQGEGTVVLISFNLQPYVGYEGTNV